MAGRREDASLISVVDDHRFLTVPHIAGMFEVKPVTVYRLVKSGQLPHLRIGKKILFDREAVIAALRRPARATEELVK